MASCQRTVGGRVAQAVRRIGARSMTKDRMVVLYHVDRAGNGDFSRLDAGVSAWLALGRADGVRWSATRGRWGEGMLLG
jgi:hypothetical protein